jgi:transcriptional regulator with XRE-family HTH domain
MTSGNLVLMARRRAGLSQRQLAERLGCRQATIARWERNDRSPSFEDVSDAVAACGLQLDAHLAVEDRSWWPQIAMQLQREPMERVRRLAPPGGFDAVPALSTLAQAGVPAVVVGQIAGALHGWPLVLDGTVELCAGSADAIQPLLDQFDAPQINDDVYELRPSGRLLLTIVPAGTSGYGDLMHSAETIDIDGRTIHVACLVDLLRIADASSDPDARRQALAYQGVIDVTRAQRARRQATPAGANDQERLEAWLSRQMPVA